MWQGVRAALIVLAFGGSIWGGPVGAEAVSADCAALTGVLRTVQGYALTVPPAGPEDGWCVLDGAVLRADGAGRPDLSAERLRLRGAVAGGVPVEFEVDLTGLRIRPKAGDRALDDRLRGLVRLQSADVALLARADPATDRLRLENLTLRLTGGTEVQMSAEVAGAGLALATLPGGRLVALDLSWRNDGRLLRPLMAMAGEAPDMPEGDAVDATRAALRAVIAALPEAMVQDESRAALERMVKALPQGRGRLEVSFRSDDGIGAASLMMAGLMDDPLGPKALALLFQGARMTAIWTPGIAP